MSATFYTDGIDCIQTHQLDWPAGWEVAFRSTHAGLYHQLYVNGKLADWTDSTDQRRFTLADALGPRELAVAAVDAEYRSTDLSALLPESLRQPGWMCRVSVVRKVEHRAGQVAALLSDHATGTLNATPLVSRELWPAGVPRWAWGQDAFGQGGFGYDGSAAPGLGCGAFGAAYFGMDAGLVVLEAALSEEGTHSLVVRTTVTDGSYVDSSAGTQLICPPPTPAEALTAVGYDDQTQTLTLEIEED